MNIASRLQKLMPGVVASKRGITFSKDQEAGYLTKIVSIRGIGERELVYVSKFNFDGLSAEDTHQFGDP